MSSDNTRVDFVLEDINTGERIILDRNTDTYMCGRNKKNFITSQSLLASREHCLFLRTNSDLNIIDRNSSNGLFINGQKQQPQFIVKLNVNDIIGLGYDKTVPEDIPTSTIYSVYKLLLREEHVEQEEPAGFIQESADVTSRNTLHIKRRQSKDHPESNVPCKVPKLEKQPTTPDIIDISDENDDEIIEENIVEEPKVCPTEDRPETGGQTSGVCPPEVNASRVKDVSSSLQDNSSDIAEPVYKDSNDLANVVVPTPLKLKRVKQEPKTRYSVLDVVVISDDEDGVFPASQLFGDEDDDEVAGKVKIKDELCDDSEEDIFENRRNDDPYVVVVSDSDDEENPFYDKIMRSQLLNESRLSGNNSIKEEREGDNFASADEDELFAVVGRLEEEEPFKMAKRAEEEEPCEDDERIEQAEPCEIEERIEQAEPCEIEERIEQAEPCKIEERIEQEDHSAAEEEEQDSEEEVPEPVMDDIEQEIHDLVFSQEPRKRKKADKSKRKAKNTENEKASEKAVPAVPTLENQSKHSSDKHSKHNKSIEKIHKEKSLEGEGIEEKPEGKRTPKKKRSSKGKKSLENKLADQRVADEKRPAENRLPEEKKDVDNQLAEEKKTVHKRLSEEKKTADNRLSEERNTAAKRLSEEKRPTNKRLLEETKTMDNRSPEEKSTAEKRLLEETRPAKRLSKDKRLSADQQLPEKKRSSVDKSIEKPSVPKQKLIEKSAEKEKRSAKDVQKSKHDAEKRRRSSDAKSLNMSDSSNDKPDNALESKTKNTDTSVDLRLKTKQGPVVILKNLDNAAARSVQIVEPPFLTNGEGRGVSCTVTKMDRSSDKLDKSVASTSGLNAEKEPARKLTTKEKKELQQKARIAEKMQLKEQINRRKQNKWAADCLPAKKKPASPAATAQERKDNAMIRKERLKQIAIEKKMAEERQPSTVKRNAVRTKAKVTTNSRNDCLFKELVEEHAKHTNANGEQAASENGDKNVEEHGKPTNENCEQMPLENGDKNSEEARGNVELGKLRTESFVNGETAPVQKRRSLKEKNKGKDVGEDEERILQVNRDQPKLNKDTNELDSAKGIPVNGEVRQYLGAIPKKPKPGMILIDQSEVPNKIPEKLPKQATKKSMMTNGISHVFGEPSLKLGQILTSGAITEEASKRVPDPRIRIGKSGKSLLKENREPNAAKEPGQTRKKKRVSFNDLNTRVDFFEIDPGNTMKKCVAKDAPLLIKKLPKCSTAESKACCPRLERFLLLILKWNPVWLAEQTQIAMPPPIVDEKKLVPLLSKYSTYDDYYNVMEPLLALELWQGISRDYQVKVDKKTPFHYYSIVNYVTETVPTTELHVTTLMLEVVVSKRDAEYQAHPVFGDLVFFEYLSNRKSKEGCQRWNVFAYVTDVHAYLITPKTIFNRELLTYNKNPHTLLTYTVMTKSLPPSDVQTNKVSRLRTITYLRSNLRMIQALQQLPVSSLCPTILHPNIEDYHLPPVSNLDAYSLVTKDKLNEKQLEAVARVTEAAVQRLPKVCLIQGPPGTGKSKVIVNLIIQMLYGNGRYEKHKKMRILVCAPSNAAIDEIALRLLEIRPTFQKENRFNMVRIGRNESMHPQVKEVSLTELAARDVKKTVATYSSSAFTTDSVEEEKRFLQARINSLELEKSNTTSCKDPLYQKQIVRRLGDVQAKYDLLMNRRPADRVDSRELSRLQRGAENTLLKGADVIACTLSSCYTNHMESIFAGKDASISVCIVDEATQSNEAETLIPLMLGVKTLVLVGDTNQLPATVLSQKAKQFGLDQSLFARIQQAFDGRKDSPIILLDTQYRMNCSVSYWPNRYFYGGALKNGLTKSSFPFHGYKIMDLESTQDDDKFSNTEEASFVANVLYTLMTSSKLDVLNAPVRIGIITPYNNQKQLVIAKIRDRIASVSDKVKKKIVYEVNTVDSFQGQERDVIIMSCVRSNGIGFLSDRQRLCVALTRAKHSLILCGNFRTFKRDAMWKALLKDAHERKAHVRIRSNAKIDEIKSHIVR